MSVLCLVIDIQEQHLKVYTRILDVSDIMPVRAEAGVGRDGGKKTTICQTKSGRRVKVPSPARPEAPGKAGIRGWNSLHVSPRLSGAEWEKWGQGSWRWSSGFRM